MYKILLVEDDLENCEILGECLALSGKYATVIAHDAQSALECVQRERFDLILLDIVLPGTDGIDLCSMFRKMIYCPIIFISCLADDETIVRAMRVGGDDYLTKPFRYPVLEAHIEAVLRRGVHESREQTPQPAMMTGVEISTAAHTLTRNGEVQYLSPTEYELLLFFASHAKTVLPFKTIYQQVWGQPSMGDLRTVFSHVHNLRKKLEPDPSNPIYIKTVPRLGYIFNPDPQQ